MRQIGDPDFWQKCSWRRLVPTAGSRYIRYTVLKEVGWSSDRLVGKNRHVCFCHAWGCLPSVVRCVCVCPDTPQGTHPSQAISVGPRPLLKRSALSALSAMADQPADAAPPVRAALLRASPVHDGTVDIVAPQPLSRLHANESATDCRHRRRTQRADDDAASAQRERAQRLPARLADAQPANEPPRSPSLSRPTAAEHTEAANIIRILRARRFEASHAVLFEFRARAAARRPRRRRRGRLERPWLDDTRGCCCLSAAAAGRHSRTPRDLAGTSSSTTCTTRATRNSAAGVRRT